MKQSNVGRVLLALCSVAAAGAAITAIPAMLGADPSTRFVEAWRCTGFATFSVLFLALACQPRGSRGLWIAVIGNKLALTLTAFAWAGEAAGASEALVADGAMTLLLVAALFLTRGWTASARIPEGAIAR